MSATIKLADGRTLGFHEYGNPDGGPVFYCHGFPGSRLDWRIVDPGDTARTHGVKVIAVDRPGSGLSTKQKGRKLLDWPADVAALADALSIHRFAVLGISGGAPFALACGATLADRVTRLGILSGMGPADAPGMREGVSWQLPGQPGVLRSPVLKLMQVGLNGDPKQFLAKSRETMATPDQAFLGDSVRADAFIDGLREALRNGIRGANRDAKIYRKPWGFALEDVSTPTWLWHGGKDANVPVATARHVASKLPRCTARFLDDEGHLSIVRPVLEEVFTTLR